MTSNISDTVSRNSRKWGRVRTNTWIQLINFYSLPYIHSLILLSQTQWAWWKMSLTFEIGIYKETVNWDINTLHHNFGAWCIRAYIQLNLHFPVFLSTIKLRISFVMCSPIYFFNEYLIVQLLKVILIYLIRNHYSLNIMRWSYTVRCDKNYHKSLWDLMCLIPSYLITS